MKKFIFIPLILVFVIIGLIVFYNRPKEIETPIEENINQVKKDIEVNSYPSYNGFLKLKDNKLVNQYDEPIILKGISSHGIQWFGDLITDNNINTLKNTWSSNVFRVAMYTKEGGYVDDPSIKDKVYNIIDKLIDKDMYIILDWHILSDSNPLTYKEEAITFFDELSKKYSKNANIIYEICNEPNGGTNWNDISKYANEIIPIIRNNSPKSLIIVGTPMWSQDADKITKLSFDNILYSLHFYTGTHKEDLRQRAQTAISNGIPIIVSEFGVSDASGTNGVYLDEADKWLEFLKNNNISIIAWSLSNKDESSAILKPKTKTLDKDNLSKSGVYLKNAIKNY